MHKFFGGYVLSFFIDCLVIVFLALLKKKTITVTSLWARSVWKKIEILILKADSGNFKHLHFPRHLAKIIQGSFFTNLQSSIIYIDVPRWWWQLFICMAHPKPDSLLTLLRASISHIHFEKWDRIKKRIPCASDRRRQMLLSIFRNFKGAFKQQLSATRTWQWISAVDKV